MATAAIAAVCCLAGISGFKTTEKPSMSALTISNIEALTNSEVTIEYDKCCIYDIRELCLPSYTGLIKGIPVEC